MNARKVSRLVLDMRSNGGGVLDAAIGIAGLFSEKPLVLFVTDAGGARQPLYSREPEVLAKQPLQVIATLLVGYRYKTVISGRPSQT
jgi:C-terminal processing protease CtpA/Prc